MGFRYCWGMAGFAPPANPTDVVTLGGMGVRGLSLRSVRMMARASTVGPITASLVRRCTPNVGGSGTIQIVTPRSSLSDPAHAKVALYSTNPDALGEINGVHESASLMMNTPNIPREPSRRMWERTDTGEDTAPFLANDREFFALNLGGAILPSGFLLDVFLEWEEATA